MNDFVKIQKLLTDESPDFSLCEEKSQFSAGESCNLRNYSFIKQFTEIGLSINESTGQLTMKGNMGMFWNGHNYNTSFADFRKGIEYISTAINVDLFPAIVEELDHSSTITTIIEPKLIIQNHLCLPDHFIHQEKHGKYFIRKGIQIVKLYDAGRRMKQICPKAMREEIYMANGIDSNMNLLRFEKKILHPESYFKSIISVNDLLHPEFILKCNDDLMETYNSITKAANLQIPNNKKYLTAATIPLIVAMELEATYGFNFRELVKQRISAIDEEILTKDDKKARRRQIKTNLNKIGGKMASEYDISEQLAESLKMDSGNQ